MPLDIHGIAPLFFVFDMPASLHFYRDLLGFELVTIADPLPDEPNPTWALLRLNGADLMLNTAYAHLKRPASPDPARIASHRDTILYFHCPDLDLAFRQLVEAGLNPNTPIDKPYGMRQLYLSDPDGFGLCFQHPIR